MNERLSRWEIWHDDSRGHRIELLDIVGPFSYSLLANEPGAFEIVLPGVWDGVFLLDDMIEIWRGPVDGGLSLENAFFVRRIKYFDDENGADWISVAGPDSKDLLRRRIVAYFAKAGGAEITDHIDDMLKQLVKDNLGASAITARDYTALGLTVQPDLAACASVTRGFAWRNLADLFLELVADSWAQGTRLYFDFVPVFLSNGTIGFNFRTYTGQIGRDRTASSGSPVYFGREWGNLASPSLEYDYSAEVNYVYAGGQGEEEDRVMVEVSDTTRTGLSPWNRCEAFADARNEDTGAAVTAKGNATLGEGRPAPMFDGVLLDTPQARYGKDWKFGDLVTATYHGRQFDGVIHSIFVTVDESGAETIEARMEVVA